MGVSNFCQRPVTCERLPLRTVPLARASRAGWERLRHALMTCLFKRAPGQWYTNVRGPAWAGGMRSRGDYTTNPQGATMKPNPKISAAVAAILWAPSTTPVIAAPADTAAATATGDQLKQLGVVSFSDLLKYPPNVTFSGNGPGTGNIFMRGLGGVGSGNQSQSTTAPFPNVALYLDDQSMPFPARNNDVYLIDMERVEILEGPQGTLFGGGAQAGAIRYITNKPQLGGVSGEANAGYGITTHGDPNTMANAVLNLPLSDSFALRAALFSERRGGYIDNVPASVGYLPGTAPHDLGGNPTANNGPMQGTHTNPVAYQGARPTALWTVNDNWDLLLQQNYQN